MNEHPSYFITWTVYGTFLQGDERGWRHRYKGQQPAQPLLANWRAERLRYPVILLNIEQRMALENEVGRLADFLRWKLWAVAARSNHVHVVLSAEGISGARARDQMKANCTRVLREQWSDYVGRPVWSEGGDWKCVNSEEELESVVRYVLDAQDKKASETGRLGVPADRRDAGVAF